MLLTSSLATVGWILFFGVFSLLNAGVQNPDEKPPMISLTLEHHTIDGFSETMMAYGFMGVLCVTLLAFRIHIVKAKAAQHNQVAIIEFVVRNGEELMAKRSYLIAELLAELTKKDDHISKEIALLAAKAAAEEKDKIHANLLQHEAMKQRDEAMGKRGEIEAEMEKMKRDWEGEIGLLKKMGWQKVEELRKVNKELGLLEKQIWSGEEEKEFVEQERDQAREGENKLAEELKKLRKENEGLLKELTSLKKEANMLRDQGKKEEEEASRSRWERKILESQRDEANREARKVRQELNRLNKEIIEGERKSVEESKAKDKKIFELQQNKAEREEENRKDHDKLVEEKKLQEKEGEAKDEQISVLQQKTTDLNAVLEAAKQDVLRLRQQMEQKDEIKLTREQNWEEYRKFWGFSTTNPYTDTPPIAGTSPAPRNTPLVLLSPRIYMPVRPPTRSLAQKVQIGVIKSAIVVTRSKPTGSPHTLTENVPIAASSVAMSPSASLQTISSGSITPLAFGPISTCTTRTQYLGSMELAKQTPRVRMPPPATHNAAAASDNGIMREYPSLDSYVVIPDKMPRTTRTSTPRGLGGKYQNQIPTPPPTSSCTSIPTTAGPFPAQRSISKNPKIAVIQLQITIRLPQTGEVTADWNPKPLAVLRPRPPPGTPRGPAQPLRSPAAQMARTTRGPGSINRKV